MPHCFVVMPISDPPNYNEGHFDVVYEHLIRPACSKGGFTPIRADEVNQTNYIALDILRRIAEADMVVCDVSGRNPNVLYELGIRHTLGRPVTIIKDTKTTKIFDIQGIRYVEYDESLRIDKISAVVPLLEETINKTYKSGGPINSLLGVLRPDDERAIRPAEPKAEEPATNGKDRLFGKVVQWSIENGRGRIIPVNSDENFYVNKALISHVGELEVGDSVWFTPRAAVSEGMNRKASCVVAEGYFLDGFVSSVKDDFGFMSVSDATGDTIAVYFLHAPDLGLSRGDRVRVQVSSNAEGPMGTNLEVVAKAS